MAKVTKGTGAAVQVYKNYEAKMEEKNKIRNRKPLDRLKKG